MFFYTVQLVVSYKKNYIFSVAQGKKIKKQKLICGKRSLF